MLTIIDLAALDGSDGFRLDGVDAGDLTGFSVSGAGDVNGDGVDDLIVGAHQAGDGGASYVVFGQSTGFAAALDLSALDGANGFRLDGAEAGDGGGFSVSGAGDVDGDGFADLIVGANFAGPDGNDYSGASYVVFGKASAFAASVDLADLDGADGFRLAGVGAYDLSGSSVSGAGDVNGDGVDDIIVGAIGGDPGGASYAGESYVVFGRTSGFGADVDLAALDGVDGFRLDGVDDNDRSGVSVAGAGDVNGDGFDDLIIGAERADPGGVNAAGESYVVFGKASGFAAAVDLAALDGADGFRLDGVDVFDFSGRSVSGAGDVNGDGFDDLIVGADSADPGDESAAGQSYVVFGKASGFAAAVDLAALDGADGFRLDGAAAGDRSGRSVSGAGDVNGDGFDDLIVGADEADDATGESYVIFGKASGFGAVLDLATLDGADGFRLDGVDVGDGSGRSVSGAGDVDGDGFDDLIVGAFEADPGGDASAGESYVIFGFDSGAVTHQGGDGGDALTGDAGVNVLIGGLGDDLLTGGGGQDSLRGGGGDDVLAIGDALFQSADGGLGEDTLRLAGVGLLLDLSAAGDQGVAGIEAVDLAAAGATIALDALAVRNLSETSNALRVTGDATTTMTLQDADWTIDADDVTTRTYVSGMATIVVDRAVMLVANGDDGANMLHGLDSDDMLLGGAGDDILFGGAGDDDLDGGDDVDAASYADAAAGVVANLTAGSAADDGDGGSDSLAEIENLIGGAFADVLIGDGGANILQGGAGLDRLDGRAGDDVMIGGTGDDIYTVNDIGDVVTELADEGRDRINVFVDYTNPGNIEFLVGKFASVGLDLSGDASRDRITGANKINSPDTLRGHGGNDVLVGLVGDDVIVGGAGNDRIFGNSGADRIRGGEGNDRVTGQFGADSFIHTPGDGRDRITDFTSGEDRLDLRVHGFADFTEVQALTSDIGGGTLIDLAGPDSIELVGFTDALLESDVLI